MNEKDLIDILNQMSEPDPVDEERDGIFTSDDSPAWHAYRKAEQVRDPGHIPFLENLLETSESGEFRSNIYTMLRNIGINTGDQRIVAILLKGLEKEKNKYTLMYLLEGIAELDVLIDCSAIMKFIRDERWLVRHSAIKCLWICNDKQVAEETLIGIINESSDPSDLEYASSVLSDIGTPRAIPHLIKLMENSNGGVKCTTIAALRDIGDNSLLPVFLEALESRSRYVKFYALSAIMKHGDETVIGPVLERSKVILKRKRVIESGELQSALEFLIRYKDDHEEVKEIFDWIVRKKWNFLFDEEKVWVEQNIIKVEK